MGKSSFLQEFKAFAMKGNVVDMAVGVIIGGAFGKIVSSLVNDVIMPPIGYLINGVNFTDLKYTLPANPLAPEGTEAATIAYGNFLQNTLDFIIVAFCIFLILKVIMRFTRKKEEETATPPTPPAPSKEELLLTEIRDLLKERK
ncbi:MAG: large-conductance mechanosensitive channel protein MscL [Paraprevotella sp.]|nr:large-conductance mechanosensitive channel protein MscL [Paraprevotella sp.]